MLQNGLGDATLLNTIKSARFFMIKLGVLPLLLMPLLAVAFSPQSILNPPVSAKDNQQGLYSKTPEFMTASDMASATLSNVSIKYTGDQPSHTVTGIYIYTLTSNPNDCTSSTLFESEGNPYGALWSPKVTMTQNQTKSIGANYLYNMIMLFLYGAYVEGQAAAIYTPGNAEDGNSEWCLWLGITDQLVGTDNLTSSTGSLNPGNILVQFILGDPPKSFTHITCDDATRLCSTTDTIQPQLFPHQRP
ncbi:MAG: hypothetical protein Q8L78_07965 [Coxiellaceae bacterium]|nr:hypothetical protein [Coxiellaceae bacterium]